MDTKPSDLKSTQQPNWQQLELFAPILLVLSLIFYHRILNNHHYFRIFAFCGVSNLLLSMALLWRVHFLAAIISLDLIAFELYNLPRVLWQVNFEAFSLTQQLIGFYVAILVLMSVTLPKGATFYAVGYYFVLQLLTILLGIFFPQIIENINPPNGVIYVANHLAFNTTVLVKYLVVYVVLALLCNLIVFIKSRLRG